MPGSEETAVCRGCGMALNGKPYHMGGSAYHPQTGARCPSNHYGGFVCSEGCDYKASVELLSSMPGCGGAGSPDCYAADTIKSNWRDT